MNFNGLLLELSKRFVLFLTFLGVSSAQPRVVSSISFAEYA